MKRLGLLLVTLLAAGCAADPENCCDRYITTEDKGVYCTAHRAVVLEFVQQVPAAEQRRARLQWVKTLLTAIQPMEDSDEIDAKIQKVQKEQPEFFKVYSKHHFWAGRDTNNLPLELRGELMKCGFRHGVHQLERELGANP